MTEQVVSGTIFWSMKKAVIATGGKQYLVTEGETLLVETLDSTGKTLSFTPLLLIDGEKISIGQPELSKSTVSANILDTKKAEKVTSIRYKAKKRVHTVRGHRQTQTQIKITKIV